MPELLHPETLLTPSKEMDMLRDHSDYTQSLTHPLTRTRSRYVVGDRFHDGPLSSGHKKK